MIGVEGGASMVPLLGKANGNTGDQAGLGERRTCRAQCPACFLGDTVFGHAIHSNSAVSAASGESAATRRGVVSPDLYRDHDPVQCRGARYSVDIVCVRRAGPSHGLHGTSFRIIAAHSAPRCEPDDPQTI